MIPMCAAKWLAAAAVATLSAWLCLLARSHGIHPLRRVLDFPGIRSKVGIVLLLPFLSATIVHGSEKLRDLINILLPSNRADNASSSAGLRTGGGDTPRSVSIPVLPDAADVGEAEGFGEMPAVTNLDICGIARWTNLTEIVFGWTSSTRPVNDLAWIYAGTDLPIFEKILPVDVSGCVSNALVSVFDSDIAGTNALDKAFYSVGDETDSDGDGASDADERFVYHTNPANPDTDGDQIPDGEEISLGTSLLSVDTDGDGLSDDAEVGSVYSTFGPLWPTGGDFVDITHLISTSACNTAIIPLQTPFQRGGETVTNVLVSAKGVVMLNVLVSDVSKIASVPFDFSRPLNTGAFTVAALSDAGLFLKSNSTVKVGVTSFTIPESYCVKAENLGRQGDGVDTNNVSLVVAFPFVRSNDVFIIYRNVVGEELDGRNASVGYQTFRSRRRKSLSGMQPGFVANNKVIMLDTGTNTDPTSADTDGDGLLDGEEVALGLSPMFADTDRDGLPDDWEIANGLDPLSASGDDGSSGDSDNDGLSNIDEYCNGTDPSSPDTDNGGASDGAEVAAGTDPNDDSDDVSTPVAAQYRELSFNINGDYAAWEMTITGLGPDDTRVRRISMGAPGSANTTMLRFRKGNSYRLRMRWLNCDDHDDDECCPWYCWQAQIDGLPNSRTFNDYSSVRLSGNEIVAGDGWIAENSDGLLTSHVHQSTYDHNGNPRPGNVAKNLGATLYVLGDPVVVFDYNRDGAITDVEADIARQGDATFRFWINDDNDSGDINNTENDIPGSGPNCGDDWVNGRGDFIDFTPAWIDTRSVFPPNTPEDIVTSMAWKVRSSCVNVVWARIVRACAGVFQREDMGYGFGAGPYQKLLSATVTNVANGAQIPFGMHDAMLLSPESGVFLIEGYAAGTNLAVEAWHGEGAAARKVVEATANIRITSVEDMYRHLNIRNLSGEAVTWQSYVNDPPNRPDAETSSTNLVFVHGANVTQQGARAWSAEVFKRMWQSGMTAKFTAVTWRSDIGADWNYQENVSNAFVTASLLAPQIADLPGTKVLMAHSLGNMVCSSMIQDYGLVPACYLMCNSAVPAEAYDADVSLRVPQLVHPEWEEYPTNSWASSWHWLFRNDANDDRKFLGWPGRFSDVAQYAVNFYSTGDEVLELANNNNVHSWTGASSSFGHYSWHKQELFKGRGGLGGTDWSGWNIEENIFGVDKISVAEAQNMQEEDFKTNTVFYCYPASMNQPSIPLLVRGAHLAQGIPVLAPATGRIALQDILDEGSCFNLNNTQLQNGIDRPNLWPELTDYPNSWRHSDIKDVSYFYNFKFYDKAIEKGNLK